MLRADQVEAREESLRLEIRSLSNAQRRELYRRLEPELKDPDTYAALNYLFVAGLHHFYLGRWLRGLVNLVVFATGLVLVMVGYVWSGVALIVGVSLLELYALFRAQVIARDFNNRVTARLLESQGRRVT